MHPPGANAYIMARDWGGLAAVQSERSVAAHVLFVTMGEGHVLPLLFAEPPVQRYLCVVQGAGRGSLVAATRPNASPSDLDMTREPCRCVAARHPDRALGHGRTTGRCLPRPEVARARTHCHANFPRESTSACSAAMFASYDAVSCARSALLNPMSSTVPAGESGSVPAVDHCAGLRAMGGLDIWLVPAHVRVATDGRDGE